MIIINCSWWGYSPVSSAVPVLKAQTGNEKVPFEPHLAVRQDQAGWMLFDIDS